MEIYKAAFLTKKTPVCYENRNDKRYRGHFDPIYTVDVFEKIESMRYLPEEQKGKNGAMQAYIPYEDGIYHSEKFLRSNGLIKTTNWVGIDIDHLEETGIDDCANKLQDIFEDIVSEMPQLLYSYISTSGKGLHLGVRIKAGQPESQYGIEMVKHAVRYCEVVEKLIGIDLRKCIDEHGFSIFQRFFINHTDSIKINRDAELVEIPTPAECPLPYKLFIDKWNSALGIHSKDTKKHWNDVEFGAQLIKIESVLPEETIHIDKKEDYTERWKLFANLWRAYRNDPEEYERQCARCIRIMIDIKGEEHKREERLSKYTEQAAKTPIGNWETAPYKWSILRKYGYNAYGTTEKAEQVKEKIKEAEQHYEKKKEDLKRTAKQNMSHIVPTDNSIEVKQGEWLDNYKSLLKEKIAKCTGKLCIDGTTGIGKTTVISDIANELKAIVLVPFISLRPIYEANGLTVITDKSQYKRSKAVCMTYDRMTTIDPSEVIGKVIFIDESHVLFMDRLYRDALVALTAKIGMLVSKYKCKIVYVSATPLEETLGAEKIKFFRNRPIVNVFPIVLRGDGRDCTNVFIKDHVITGFLDKYGYDRNIVFTNRKTRNLYDTCSLSYPNGNILGILHSEYSTATDDYQWVVEHRTLNKRTTFCTSMAFNGLNFDNENERIAVWTVLEPDTSSWELIQQVGRVRKSVVDLFVIYNEVLKDGASVEEKEELKEIIRDNGLGSPKLLEPNKLSAHLEVQQYINSHNTPEQVFNELEAQGYFNIQKQVTVDYTDKKSGSRNKLKESVDTQFKEFVSTSSSDIDFDLESYSIPKVNFEGAKKRSDYYNQIIKELYTTKNELDCNMSELIGTIPHLGTKYVTTMCGELTTIWRNLSVSEEIIPNEKEVKATVSTISSEYVRKEYVRKVNSIKKTREEYGEYEDSSSAVIDHYREVQDVLNKKKATGNKNGGKKVGGANKIPFDLLDFTTGEKLHFDSESDAAEKLHCNIRTIKSIKEGKTRVKQFKKYILINGKE